MLFTGEHISHLGSVIDKLRGDIGQLEDTVNNVKNTQQTVRSAKNDKQQWHQYSDDFAREEYEETLMNQRKMFDDEIQELNNSHSRAIEKLKKFPGVLYQYF